MIRHLSIRGLAALAIVGALSWMGLGPHSNNTLGAAFAQETETAVVEEMSLGNPDAAVTVIEYASFTCPHCRTFHENAFKDLKAEYIDTGKINFIYREVYFDRFGLWAGLLARCGGSERYFGFVDELYAGQGEWTAGGDPATIANNLRRIGRTAGLSEDEVNACMSDQAKAEALVAAFEENAAADGINSTPSFVINGTRYSNMSYADFSGIIEEALGS